MNPERGNPPEIYMEAGWVGSAFLKEEWAERSALGATVLGGKGGVIGSPIALTLPDAPVGCRRYRKKLPTPPIHPNPVLRSKNAPNRHELVRGVGGWGGVPRGVARFSSYM